MKTTRLMLLFLGAIPLLPALHAAPAHAYSQSADQPVHQWITQQAWLFFRSQFGASEIDDYLGEVRAYEQPGDLGDANKRRVIQGVYDEDIAGRNPFGETVPTLRHFWEHDAGYVRQYNDGLAAADSAANRAPAYFTGGEDLKAEFNSSWGNGQGAEGDHGIIWQYENAGAGGTKDRAYYWLGSVAHLLQDMGLPSHVHGDDHVELGGGVTGDPDIIHDWVDGRAFSDSIFQNPTRRAAFNDTQPRRWENWAFHAGPGGVGRMGGTQPLITADIRSPAAVLAAEGALPDQSQKDTIAANLALFDLTRPLFNLFLETAGRADDFDTIDVDGEKDKKGKSDRSTFDLNGYDNWTMLELNQVADATVPVAMRSTAELFRYFYSLVDPTPPELSLDLLGDLALSTNPLEPTDHPSGLVPFQSMVTELTSGYDLDGFSYDFDVWNGMGWDDYFLVPAAAGAIHQFLTPGLYRVKAAVQNGAGLTGQSGFYYVNAIPEPQSLTLLAITLTAAAFPRRRLQSRSRLVAVRQACGGLKFG